MTVSLCMIVKNEEAVLGRCLDCAKQFADEIIVVDTGSTDRTVEIARQYTGLVFSYEWHDDFAAARNFAFSKGSGDYLMWLDADDIVEPEQIMRLRQLKETLPGDVDVVMLPYHTGFDSRGRVTFRYYRERLVKREKGMRWREPVHEYIAMEGTVRQYDIPIVHGQKERGFSDRNLVIYQKQLEQGRALSTRGLYYFARELFTHGRLEEAAGRYREFLERDDGWVEDRISACTGLADCLTALGRAPEARRALLQSFEYDLPRGEALCRLSQNYLEAGEHEKARFWLEMALEAPRPQGWGFVTEDYWGYIPHMQLCLLYDRAGEREKALEHHRKAQAIKPDDPSVLHNEAYFSKLLKKEE